MVITDDIVDGIYATSLCNQLGTTPFEVFKFVFKSGDANKNLKNYETILEFLSNIQVSKSDVILAFGGGVVGDIAGFVASTYLRGIKFINIPTTILSAVDASIGEKNGVNLENGKNLVGSFLRPSLVLIDLDVFSSLTTAEISNGISEIIKYATICDYEFFQFLESNDIIQHLEGIIRHCIEVKLEFVCKDKYDKSERQKLNFGHTLGHAIEKCSNYKIPHGKAVAIGMACITRAAVKMGICEKETYFRLIRLLKKYNLPFECECDVDNLYKTILSDKKRLFDVISFVFVNRLGNAILYPSPIKSGEALSIVRMALGKDYLNNG